MLGIIVRRIANPARTPSVTFRIVPFRQRNLIPFPAGIRQAATAATYNVIDPERVVEEETMLGYKHDQYYLVNIGDSFYDRYKVVGKLGYGTVSTVWLCHDLSKEQETGEKIYVALKVYINTNCIGAPRELPIYRHINSLSSNHGGRHRVRKLLDSFEIEGPDGKHLCLVHEALGMNFDELRDRMVDGLIATDVLRQSFKSILRAINFLHTEARVIHTDVQPKNMLLGIHDNAAFVRFENEEREDPLPRKELPSRTIYRSRIMHITQAEPSLSDLSEARFGNIENAEPIMPKLYRAPEVMLDLSWSYPVDIWGFAMTIWDLVENKRLFRGRDETGVYSEHHHLAQMIAVMGPAPLDFLQRSPRSHLFWDSDGNWKNIVPIPELSLEAEELRFEGQEKVDFLNFMRKMLQWKPEDRKSLDDVFMDEWLLLDLIEAGIVARD